MPEEYPNKLGLAPDATYHDAAKLLLHDRFRTKGNFTLRTLFAAVTTFCVVLGAFHWVPFTLRLVQREPLLGNFVVAGLALAVAAVVVGVWRLAGKSLVR